MFFVFFQGILEICEEDNIINILAILKSDFSVFRDDSVSWSETSLQISLYKHSSCQEDES